MVAFAFGSMLTEAERIPWVPLGEGESFKPLRLLDGNRGRVLLLRLEPGVVVPRHRHRGEVHGFNVEGSRKLLDSGETVGPGDYVYEPAGNVDSWMAIGSTPVTVFIAVRGAMEYLDDADNVLRADDTAGMLATYERYCADQGIDPIDLRG